MLASDPAAADATLGKAKAIPEAVLQAKVPEDVEKLMPSNGYGLGIDSHATIKAARDTVRLAVPTANLAKTHAWLRFSTAQPP